CVTSDLGYGLDHW
nr:immunoglobulin heavy chain junction region [Macaca mulatta]MOW47149.1 immunoglobulin heavy chain junction region [Macaca mulatta]MOW47729.1 immunoglobulin heavy chain junction region [Macaca mulatta]MOW47954.1 immunoglobulin heavy chain junction region [Macaca mulatta]MOW49189.1 immunoglobulin heavy chain junction region [Macaca mulatta]